MGKKKTFWTREKLLKMGVPLVLIPGLLLGLRLGWGNVEKIKNYYQDKTVFPVSGMVKEIKDGDTFVLEDGTVVRLLAVNTPDRGDKNYEEVAQNLVALVKNKRAYLEYDRYQDDKYGRILAWVWVDCEGTPKFLPFDYMYKSKNESNEGLIENPVNCKRGQLVNEEVLRKSGLEPVFYKDRGELKYQKRLKMLQ